MSRLSATTGISTLKAGTTDLKFGVVNPLGVFVIRELHNSSKGAMLDHTRQKLPASTMGANAGVLGDWVVRDIDVPDGTVMFVRFMLKSLSMPMKKGLTFAFEVSDANPYVELTFPVVQDRHSTLHELPISGRLRLLSSTEIQKDFDERIKAPASLMHSEAKETLSSLSEEGVLNYWAALATNHNHEGKTFLTVQGNTSFEEYPIKVKYLLPASVEGTVKPKGKLVKTATGRKVTIAGRKRRILLS